MSIPVPFPDSVRVPLENQCVTADQIAEAFLQLLQADQISMLVVLLVGIFVGSAPYLIERVARLLDAKREAA